VFPPPVGLIVAEVGVASLAGVPPSLATAGDKPLSGESTSVGLAPDEREITGSRGLCFKKGNFALFHAFR
jgi:hypothetical protein